MTRLSVPGALQALTTALTPADTAWTASNPDWASLDLAAVLVLLFPRGDDIRFPLTVRQETLTHHPGQVSLPGGRVDPTDETGWHTATREAREELGVNTGRLRLLGCLSPVPTVVSNHLIIPYVGWSPTRPRLSHNPQEVAKVLEVSLQMLLSCSNVDEEAWEIRGRRRVITYYRFGDYKVWGATGTILSDLAHRMDPSPDLPAHLPGTVRAPE